MKFEIDNNLRKVSEKENLQYYKKHSIVIDVLKKSMEILLNFWPIGAGSLKWGRLAGFL